MRRRLYLFFPALLAVALIFNACVTAPPSKISNARGSRNTDEIKDPVAYKKAVEILNQARRQFIRKRFSAALTLVNRSLETHESFGGYYLKGSTLFQLNRTEESLAAYKKAEERRPKDEQLLMSAAVVHTARGEMRDALSKYLTLHQAYPKEPVYAFKAGTTYKILKDYPKAYDYLRKADVPDYRHRDQVYLQLGDTALELKKYQESEDYFNKARALNPKLKDAGSGTTATRIARLLDQGNQAFAAKNYDEALAKFEQARTVAPNSPAPYLLSATVQLVQDKATAARDNVIKALKLNPKNPRGYSLLASAYRKLKQYSKAAKTLDTGLKIAPESFEMHNKMGLVHRDQEQTRRAIESFDRAIRLKADYVPARINLAFALLDDKRFADAEEQFKAAAKLEPDNKDLKRGRELVKIYAILDKGDRFFQSNRSAAAVAQYKKALKLKSDLPLIHNSIGRAEYSGRRYAASLAAFEKALKLDPKNIPAMQGLLRTYNAPPYRRRYAGKRRALVGKLTALTRNDVSAAVALGRIKEDEGKLAEAEKIYKGLLKKNPDSDLLKRRLGYVYYKRGLWYNKRERYTTAKTNFEKAASFNPDIPQLPETLKIVRENIQFASLLPTVKKAEYYYNRRRYTRALPLYQSVYAKLKRPLLLVKIANCYIYLGQEERGLNMLKSAEKGAISDPAISEAIYTYSMKKGRLDVAEKGFKQIVEQHPNAHYSLYKLGIIELIRKNYNESLDYLNRALIYKPDFIVGYIARGVVWYQKDEKPRARKEFETALTRDEDSALASFNIGVMLYNDNLLDKARGVFEKITKKNPDFSDAHYHLSYIYYSRNDLPAAEKELKAALKADPEPRYRYALSQVYEKKYQATRSPTDAAILKQTYQDIITRNPGSRYAVESRRKLRSLNPGERVVHKYKLERGIDRKPVLYNGNLYVVNGNRLQVFDARTKQVLWSRGFSGTIRDIMLSQVVHVLAGGRVSLMDPFTGDVESDFAVASGAEQLTGRYDRIGVVSEVRSRRRVSSRALAIHDAGGKRLANHQADATMTFFFGGDEFFRFHMKSGSAFLQRLNATSSVQYSVVPIPGVGPTAVPTFNRAGNRIYLFFPGQALVVVERDSWKVKKTYLSRSSRTLIFAGDEDRSLLLPTTDSVQVLNAGGGKEKTIRLPVRAGSVSSVLSPASKRLVYVGSDGKIHMVDFDGKLLWSRPLKSSGRGSEVFSLYY